MKLTEAEQKMSEALVDLMAGEFDPKEYKDAYREALMEVISAKLEGKEVISVADEPTVVMDLMDALRVSVEAAKARRAS